MHGYRIGCYGTTVISPVNPKRPYVSPRRAAAADATRRAILDAARALFTERGYAATTVDAIAARAAVSPKTVYAVFGTKRAVLSGVLDSAIAGDDRAVPIIERDWVRSMRDAPDPRERLAILAREGAAILGRRSEMDDIIGRAAAADPELSDFAAGSRAQRRDGQAALLRIALGDDVDEAAIDTLFAVGSPEVYRLLVTARGWSHDRFVAWYTDTVRRLFDPAG